jgi:hypothetical protein
MNALTQGQQEAADGFFEFLLSDEKEMIISGPAGVGKTHLLGYLIDRVMPMYLDLCTLMGQPTKYFDVNLTATTNKSADVLAGAAKRPVETIQKFLNLVVRDDWDTGRSKLQKNNNWHVHIGKIIFIEECSMVDTPLDQMIQEGTHECKIIYVGDHCQLTPVMEAISPIYRRGLRTYELKEQVRNAHQPALMDLCRQLRLTVETGDFKPIKIVPGVIDWATNEQMEDAIQTVFAQQTDDYKILAYTNQRVTDYNEHIRNVRNLPVEYQAGEQLINNTGIRLHDTQISVEETVTILRTAPNTAMVPITSEVSLAVRYCDLQTKFKGKIESVPLPVDRAHYHELIKYFGRVKDWNRYFHLKNVYPDLRPKDASTFHKAQGSTYDTVFIDAGNLSVCHQPDTVARMLYVAGSRPRNRIIFYGHLASKYGGFVE